MKQLKRRHGLRSTVVKPVAFLKCMRYTLDMPQRMWRRKGSAGSVYGEVVIGLYVILVSATVYAGTLTPGKPRVESDRYEVPIYLNGAANEVAALDFSLAYDPAVFQPVSISPGAAASAAGKLVTANLPEPGKYIVVMMGFNQTPVANGEVARIVLERVGSAPQGETKLTVGDTTLSTWEGVELPAEGGSAALTVASKDEKPSGDNGTKPDAGKPEKPETPETPTTGETPSTKTRGNPRLNLAGAMDEPPTAGAGPKEASAVKTAAVPNGEQTNGVVPDVDAAAAKAAEERSRLGEVPVASESGPGKKTSAVEAKQDGQPARTTDIQTSSSLKIEASDPVNKNNTAETTQPGGMQRESAAAGGWMRLGLAAAVLLAAAGVAWLLRYRIFR